MIDGAHLHGHEESSLERERAALYDIAWAEREGLGAGNMGLLKNGKNRKSGKHGIVVEWESGKSHVAPFRETGKWKWGDV